MYPVPALDTEIDTTPSPVTEAIPVALVPLSSSGKETDTTGVVK